MSHDAISPRLQATLATTLFGRHKDLAKADLISSHIEAERVNVG